MIRLLTKILSGFYQPHHYSESTDQLQKKKKKESNMCLSLISLLAALFPTDSNDGHGFCDVGGVRDMWPFLFLHRSERWCQI